MGRFTPVLAVLLLASLLGNALLAVRLSRRPEPDPVAATARKGSVERTARAEESPAGLQSALDAEKKKNEELRARIALLETDKKVLVQESPGGSGKADKLAVFKTKLRKLFKMMKDPAAKAGAVDPDSMVELTDAMMEFYKLSATRAKDPKAYADYLQAFYEIGLEGEGTTLTADQTSALTKLLQEYGAGLAQVPSTPAGERLLKEVELEAAAMARVKTVLTEAQMAAMAKDNMNMIMMGNMMSMSYVSTQGGAEMLAQQWSALYGLDAEQLPQAKAAAQSYLDAMARASDGKLNGFSFDKAGTPESYDFRLRSVREELAALNMLSASMTPAQQDRLRTQAMKEIFLMDTASFGATVEKK